LVISVLGHIFIGKYLNVYHRSIIYDRYLHLFGSFSFALLFFSIINNTMALVNEGWIFTSFFIIILGIAIGVLVEIAEFIHDSFSKKDMYQHGLVDTNLDMIFNVIGSCIAGVISIGIF